MNRRPRIGLSSCFFHPDPERPVFKGKTLLYVEESMAHWVAGGDALVYPIPTPRPDGPLDLGAWVADLDGLVLHGGADLSPGCYDEDPLRPEWSGDERRDRYEIELLQRFLDADKPVLGICRGMQLMNVAFGGSLWQDLVAMDATPTPHRNQELYDHHFHDIEIAPDSELARLLGRSGRARVNSVHHQGVKETGKGMVVEARAPHDGVVEALRLDGDRWCVGVQWHPEFFDPADDSLLDNLPLRAAFLEQARSRA